MVDSETILPYSLAKNKPNSGRIANIEELHVNEAGSFGNLRFQATVNRRITNSWTRRRPS
jgi:hypothetical protein